MFCLVSVHFKLIVLETESLMDGFDNGFNVHGRSYFSILRKDCYKARPHRSENHLISICSDAVFSSDFH